MGEGGDVMTEGDITQLLRAKYRGRDWAFLAQVPNGTGTHKSRTCDGMAMSLWPSKGLHLHGFEIKVSRGDWLAEIQQPEKSEAFIRYCHYWWIVAPAGVVKLDEVAGNWGVQEVTKQGDKLRVTKAASLMSPIAVDPSFLAALFRAMRRESSEHELQTARQEGYSDGFREGQRASDNQQKRAAEWAGREDESLRRSVAAFEAASGLAINAYNGGSLGEQVARARKLEDAEAALSAIRKRVERLAENLR
jgi:hypothetical protein